MSVTDKPSLRFRLYRAGVRDATRMDVPKSFDVDYLRGFQASKLFVDKCLSQFSKEVGYVPDPFDR